ncbi:hypothetical protein SELMODRAFT_422373 [Selaginella moellendorffii]|uniref:Uncharacterized protein n=1 Tax=Selaginella moellendorffii TaxID=88036 RepID=D8SI70_SELML|nr:uncharacterized protein LOC9654298 [Selaginella moellendorffii]EFJ15921.1 hypothetical protein SELMODRAFT_422373 [Selaginella moellendorffii]|eukprot:XP_002983112.1 uncharacterized protein LOC9654298 [Selaginella moellendorffii]
MARLLTILLLVALAVDRGFASKRRAITDDEILAKKKECLQDINSGLWGWKCQSSSIAKQNCMLQCVSWTCYDLIYGNDALEEGEVDIRRGRQFRECLRRESKGDDVSSLGRSFFDD